jgi:nitrate reductase alpha subunit
VAEPDARQAGRAGWPTLPPAGGVDRELLAPLLPGGEPVEGLLRRAQFFVPGEPSGDFREVHRKGGRGAEEFYRERWRHDKVVRSTHGVNCTGSCSWKVYVKDGIITWETQQTDYPSAGPRPSRPPSA